MLPAWLVVASTSLVAFVAGAALWQKRKLVARARVEAEQRRGFVARGDTLASLMQSERVPMADLHRRGYWPVIGLVRALLGVEPLCDEYLCIDEPSFVMYNLLPPNLMDLPALLAWCPERVRALVSAGMTVSSQAASCAYCTAHTCALLVRHTRATPTEALLTGATVDEELESVRVVATGLGTVPATLSRRDRDHFATLLGPELSERVLLGIAQMGFLNKVMDALGVELELPAIAMMQRSVASSWSAAKADALSQTASLSDAEKEELASEDAAWSQSSRLGVLLSLLPLAPFADLLDLRWTWRVPSNGAAACERLKRAFGFEFPALRRIKSARAVRAICALLELALRDEQQGGSTVGLEAKLLSNLVFAVTAGNVQLRDGLISILQFRCATPRAVIDAVVASVDEDGDNRLLAALNSGAGSAKTLIGSVMLARQIASSPASVSDATVKAAGAVLSAPQLVELVTSMAAMQLVQRLDAFFDA
jgi:hypothetical protein